ncbi:PilZ domain-containing protein [Myxococcaceae bacterium GXIMD 01537]
MQRKGAPRGKAAAPAQAPAASGAEPAQEAAGLAPPAYRPPEPRAPVNRVDEARAPDDWRRHLTPRAEPARPAAPRGAAARPLLPMPIFAADEEGEPEHRHFPRAGVSTRAELWMDDDEGGRRFTASLQTANVSISGAFVESTFFLPVGTELNVRFSLEEGREPVQARAQIVREERADGPGGRTGFGLRFVEFTGQTEVSLARLFLGARLRAFAEEYMQSRRSRSLPNELERVVDVLAAWELLKATTPGDPWRGE